MSATDCRPTHPNGRAVTRTVRIGGASKAELLSNLCAAGVRLNEAAQTLFADDRFTTSVATSLIETVELSVAGLGLPNGATFAEIVEQAARIGLLLCPLELGRHLRLQLIDQCERFVGQPPSQDRAPPGAVTVASAPPADDKETPRGFYLRRIEGVLWLRVYRSSPAHIWGADDVFIFSRPRMD
jgi:hypothetical protein